MKLYKTRASCDAKGNVWSKGKLVKKAKVELVEQEKALEEEGARESQVLAVCEENTIQKDEIQEDPVKEPQEHHLEEATKDSLSPPLPAEEPTALESTPRRLSPSEPEENPVMKQCQLIPILEGLKLGKDASLVNGDGVVVGELIQGDIATISKKYLCSAEGTFASKMGKIIGCAQALPLSSFPPAECTEPSISQDSLCSLRAQHVLGDGWKDCEKCCALIRQVSAQLAHEEADLR